VEFKVLCTNIWNYNENPFILLMDDFKIKFKNLKTARRQWLMPIILATHEAEIRRIKVQSQPQQIVQETLSRKTHPSQKSGSRCKH
jgi:hypothetical protein